MTYTLLAALTVSLCALITVFFLLKKKEKEIKRIREKEIMNDIFINITHGMLTPLTIISVLTEYLREKEPQYDKNYNLIQTNVFRLTQLLQQILETSKSQAGELKLLVSQGDVMAYIKETAHSIEPLMRHRNMVFTINCSPEHLNGWIDTDKINKILFNLLVNAAKFAGEQSKVTLDATATPDGNTIILRVTDNGNGIPKEKMPYLFKRFMDGEYRTSHMWGTGIGLALTYDLTMLHHGKISCDSQKGKGTTFTITLPINKETYPPHQIDETSSIDIQLARNQIIDIDTASIGNKYIEPDAEGEPGEESYKILIAEEDEELLNLMTTILCPHYHIITATNSTETLEKIHNSDIDLAILDIQSPEMDSLQLTRMLKNDKDYSHMPIILMSQHMGDADRNMALLLGVDEYVSKPFKIGELRLRINNIIKNRLRTKTDFQQQSIEEARKSMAGQSNEDQEFMDTLLSYIYKNLSDPDYDRFALARDMGSSTSTLYNKLRSLTGMSVSNFIRNIRMKTARQMMQEKTDIRISDLAYSVGYKDPKYFSTSFKREFGMQPKEYIESLRAAATQHTTNI